MESRAQQVLAGDPRALARAATLVENRTAEAHELLKELFSHTGRATVVGVTGKIARTRRIIKRMMRIRSGVKAA